VTGSSSMEVNVSSQFLLVAVQRVCHNGTTMQAHASFAVLAVRYIDSKRAGSYLQQPAER
jgi:hypothetical protein